VALVRQFTTYIIVLLFLSSSFLGSLESLPEDTGFDSTSSVSILDDDSPAENPAHSRSLKRSQRGRPEDDCSSETAANRRSLKRTQRGKASLNQLSAVDKPARRMALDVFTAEATLFSHPAKSHVYQQTNVYRI
jgi:hypothetical protein